MRWTLWSRRMREKVQPATRNVLTKHRLPFVLPYRKARWSNQEQTFAMWIIRGCMRSWKSSRKQPTQSDQQLSHTRLNVCRQSKNESPKWISRVCHRPVRLKRVNDSLRFYAAQNMHNKAGREVRLPVSGE